MPYIEMIQMSINPVTDLENHVTFGNVCCRIHTDRCSKRLPLNLSTPVSAFMLRIVHVKHDSSALGKDTAYILMCFCARLHCARK